MKVPKNLANAAVIGRLDAKTHISERSEQAWVKGGRKHGWYVPRTNTYPLSHALFKGDLSEVIKEFVLPGHVPAQPLLRPDDRVITLGSCFARELRLALSESGVESSRFWIPSGLNNTFAILDFFSWCVTGAETQRGFRYERGEGGKVTEWKPEREREAYAASLAGAGAFVFTLGLAEVWQDRVTGAVFWRGVPDHVFDENRHVFRLTTVDENAANLVQIVGLVRQVNPTAPIIFTLSPIPLLASFREISCLTADCVSKSVLRVALDQLMNERLDSVYYWPSFEIVRWVGSHLPYSAFGESGKARDVKRRMVGAIVDTFITAFYTPAGVAAIQARRGTPASTPALENDD